MGDQRARRTHINDIDVLETREGEVFEDLAAEAASSAVKGQVDTQDGLGFVQT